MRQCAQPRRDAREDGTDDEHDRSHQGAPPSHDDRETERREQTVQSSLRLFPSHGADLSPGHERRQDRQDQERHAQVGSLSGARCDQDRVNTLFTDDPEIVAPAPLATSPRMNPVAARATTQARTLGRSSRIVSPTCPNNSFVRAGAWVRSGRMLAADIPPARKADGEAGDDEGECNRR